MKLGNRFNEVPKSSMKLGNHFNEVPNSSMNLENRFNEVPNNSMNLENRFNEVPSIVSINQTEGGQTMRLSSSFFIFPIGL